MIRNYFGNKYPYTDFHELNLDWILSVINDLREAMKVFVEYNEIKYADPILWDITTQYQQNTIVQDPQGNTHLSKQPVPAGIALTNTDYWIKVADFDATANLIRQAISFNNDGASPVSSANRSVGDLVWWNNILYEVIQPITAGSAYDATGLTPNIAAISLEQLISGLDGRVTQTETDIVNIQTQLSALKSTYQNALYYGADPTGATDNTQIIQDLIDDLTSNGGGMIYFPAGTYLFNSTLYIKSNVSLIGDGDASVLVFEDVPISDPINTARMAIWGKGEALADIAASPTTIDDVYITVSDSSTFAVGDLVEIFSTTQRYDYQGLNDGTYVAELAVIEEISGNVLRLDHGHYVAISSDCYIHKINAVENVSISMLTVKGEDIPDNSSHGIYFSYSKNVSVDHVKVVGFAWYSIGIISTYVAMVTNNTIIGVFFDGITGQIFYGVAVMNDSVSVLVQGNYATKERHLYVNSAYTTFFKGTPMHINVIGNIAIGMEYGGAGVSYAFEHHGQGSFINISENISYQCFSGANIEGSNVKVSGNIFLHNEVAGVMVGDAYALTNISIEGNMIDPPIHKYATYSAYAGVLVVPPTIGIVDLRICNNRIRYTAYPAIYVPDGSYVNLVIDGNVLTQLDTSSTYAAVLHNTNTNLSKFCNNILQGIMNGVRILGKWLIHNNSFDGQSGANQTIHMDDSTASCIVNNYIEGLIYGVYSAAGKTLRLAANNVFIKASTADFITSNTTVTTNVNNVSV